MRTRTPNAIFIVGATVALLMTLECKRRVRRAHRCRQRRLSQGDRQRCEQARIDGDEGVRHVHQDRHQERRRQLRDDRSSRHESRRSRGRDQALGGDLGIVQRHHHRHHLGGAPLCARRSALRSASFADLDVCLRNATKLNVETCVTRSRRLISRRRARQAGESCINAIGKAASKLLKTVQKEKTKAIAASDKAGGDSGYTDPGDPNSKIASAVASAQAAISAACAAMPVQLGSRTQLRRGCGQRRSMRGKQSRAAASGLSGAMFDEPGICPSSTRLTFHGGAQGGAIVGDTELDWGWKGWFHDQDLTGDSSIRAELDCGLPTGNDCSSCTVSATCDEDNCRCANDNSISCDEPFGPDANDCGGNNCQMFLRPPLADHRSRPRTVRDHRDNQRSRRRARRSERKRRRHAGDEDEAPLRYIDDRAMPDLYRWRLCRRSAQRAVLLGRRHVRLRPRQL